MALGENNLRRGNAGRTGATGRQEVAPLLSREEYFDSEGASRALCHIFAGDEVL